MGPIQMEGLVLATEIPAMTCLDWIKKGKVLLEIPSSSKNEKWVEVTNEAFMKTGQKLDKKT